MGTGVAVLNPPRTVECLIDQFRYASERGRLDPMQSTYAPEAREKVALFYDVLSDSYNVTGTILNLLSRLAIKTRGH